MTGTTTRLAAVWVCGLWLVALCACGSDQSEASDTGQAHDDGLGDASAPLVLPEPPLLTPCPTGWRQLAASSPQEPATCHPWPEGGALSCPDGEAHFVGDSGCTPIGDACPEGEWATGLPTHSPVLYVRAGAGSGGTGTPETPFGSLGEALATAMPGTVVALGKGTFDEVVEVPTGVTLWGACVTETTVTSSEPWEPGYTVEPVDALLVTGRDVVLRNFAVGGARPGIGVTIDGITHVQNVLLDRASFAGLIVAGQVSLVSVVIRDTVPMPSGDYGWLMGIGLAARRAREVTLDRVVVDGSQGMGLAVEGASAVSVSRTVVRGTQELNELGGYFFGTGLSAFAVQDLSVRQSVFEQNVGFGMAVGGGGTSTVLSEILIRGDDEPHRGTIPGGLVAGGPEGELAPQVRMERSVIEQTRYWGVIAFHADLTLTDVLIRDVRGYGAEDREEWGGFGLTAVAGSEVTLERVALLRAEAGSIWTDDTFLSSMWKQRDPVPEDEPADCSMGITTVMGQDVRVDATREMKCASGPCEGGAFGAGVAVTGACARVELRRFALQGNALLGLQLAEGGTADLSEGQVSRNPIGVNVQTPEFNIERLQDRVFYLDNGRNLDAERLPVPSLANFSFLGEAP
jgi:hypothetical protein